MAGDGWLDGWMAGDGRGRAAKAGLADEGLQLAVAVVDLKVLPWIQHGLTQREILESGGHSFTATQFR